MDVFQITTNKKTESAAYVELGTIALYERQCSKLLPTGELNCALNAQSVTIRR
jgi:hypothetical protein